MPEFIQRKYYERTADSYDELHVSESDEHALALAHMTPLLSMLSVRAMLDVGCGTGRVARSLSKIGVRVQGLEPVRALIDVAIRKKGISRHQMIQGTGYHLPFRDGCFDAVCEFGTLHHVETPNVVVKEMMRVASKAVFLSDSNRFGQGNLLARLAKLMLYKVNLWKLTVFVWTRGKGYFFSEGDGLSFSYSVFDSYDLFERWADQVICIPTGEVKPVSWNHPLLTSSHILVCAIKHGHHGADSRQPLLSSTS